MLNDIRAAAKLITARHNVSFRVIDSKSGKIVSTHTGHNAATNSLLTGIGHYLTGDGILNQGYPMLYNYIPKYISLGTMGLISQEQDGEGLPAGIGVIAGTEEERFVDYMMQTPGYGADGYDPNINNNRAYFGLGPIFANREAEVFTETLQVGDLNRDGKVDEEDVQILANYIGGEVELEPWQVVIADLDHNGRVDCQDLVDLVTFVNSGAPIEDLGTIEYSNDSPATINCELISDSFPRAKITFRDPSGHKYIFKRAAEIVPVLPKEVLPHPKGVSADDILFMAKHTDKRRYKSMLTTSLSRMSNKRVAEIEEMTGIDMNKRPKDMKWAEAEAIVDSFQKMKFMAPPSNGLIPIGSEQIEKGMKQILKPEFVATLTRKPVTYKGGVSFIVEAGIAYGGDAGRIVNEQRKSEIMRFANRVPLTFDQGSCAITEALKSIDWKRYGLKDLDNTPLTLFVNLISTQVPYLSTGKQSISP